MKKIIPFIFSVLVMALLAACDDHDNAPEPVIQLRAESMSYGESSYRILQYDNQNRVSAVLSGFLVEGDSAEVTHRLVYDGDKIDRFELTDQAVINYVYEGDRIKETLEYLHGTLIANHYYTYDARGRVSTWEIERVHDDEGDVLAPDAKYVYTYGDDGNLVTKQDYIYEESAYRLFQTVTYGDFDDKKNYDVLFLFDIYNLLDVKFKNNPRTLKIVSAPSGVTIEEHFQLEYNDQGYVTRSISDAGAGFIYRYKEF